MTINPAPEPAAQAITGLTAAEQTAFVTAVVARSSVSDNLQKAVQIYLAQTRGSSTANKVDRPEGQTVTSPER